jgi:adenylate kinase family enzyme
MLILGKPGGGKGTISGKQTFSIHVLYSTDILVCHTSNFCTWPISEKILSDFPQFHHVSTGDLLRQHVRECTPLGKEAKGYMKTGKLVPDALMIDLVMADATPFLEEGKSLLLDGFPRSLRQAEALEKVAHIDMVVNLDVPTNTIVDRIADR